MAQSQTGSLKVKVDTQKRWTSSSAGVRDSQHLLLRVWYRTSYFLLPVFSLLYRIRYGWWILLVALLLLYFFLSLYRCLNIFLGFLLFPLTWFECSPAFAQRWLVLLTLLSTSHPVPSCHLDLIENYAQPFEIRRSK